MAFLLLRAEVHLRRPWRNGGGMTAEVAAWPPDGGSDFDWRVSFADVAGSGDFSTFAGVDRVITLIDGPPMTLELPSQTTVLRPFAPYSFDGELQVRYAATAPTQDLNVMTRRGRASAAVEVLAVAMPEVPITLVPTSPLLVVGLTGEVTVRADAGSVELGPRDVLTTDQNLAVDGDGQVAIVRITSSWTAQRA